MAPSACPDGEAIPPDDPAAHPLMRHPAGWHNHKYWDQLPTAGEIEQYGYLAGLPRAEDGRIEVSPELAIELALIHSRDYQTRFEQVYLTALSLTGNRFEFETQWSGGTSGDFLRSGEDLGDSRLLTLGDRLGFRRQFARGGQLAVGLVNSLSWQFTGGQFSAASGGLVAALTLPLLRGAGSFVRLEGLVQAERDLLYSVRDFARFRRQFYQNVVTGYYGLLGQVQSIRNTRTNLTSLELNLREHQELLAQKAVSQIQVDQVFQDYQNGRLSLLSAEQSLADSLDQFKFLLGLPPWVDVRIDEALLQPFELNTPELLGLQEDVQALFEELLTFLPPDVPSPERMEGLFDRYQALQQRVAEMVPQTRATFEGWNAQFSEVDGEPEDADDRLDWIQQRQIARQLGARLDDLTAEIGHDTARMDEYRREILEPEPAQPAEPAGVERAGDALPTPAEAAWARLTELVGRRLREQVAEIYSAEIQSRVFAIDLPALQLSQQTAMQFARENRLDLMNAQAEVVDAFRRTEVAANALRSQLDVTAGGNLGTQADRTNPVRFDASSSSWNVGVDFDGPLNRLNERNDYRAAQVAYQQSRRRFMASEDQIANVVRTDLRDLRIQRLNFQIARQQLIAATRQVDEAQFNLRTATQSSTNLTRDLLQALQGLLNARNNLIRSWTAWKTTRIALFVDLELLYLDENGSWTNEDFDLDRLAGCLDGAPLDEELANAFGIARSPLFLSDAGDMSVADAPQLEELEPGGLEPDHPDRPPQPESEPPVQPVQSDSGPPPIGEPGQQPGPSPDGL